MVLTGYFALSLAIGLFVTIAGAMRKHCRQLDISVEISGPHGLAVRLTHVRRTQPKRPSQSRAQRSVTIGQTPLFEGQRNADRDIPVSTPPSS